MTAEARPARARWLWLAAVVLMLAEFLVFDRMTSHYHTKFYPRWNDQIQYLTEAYTAYSQAQAHGLLAGLKFALSKTALQGTLHDFGAVLVFRLAGSASRSAALGLNFLVFLAWQAALLAVIPRVTGSRALGWLAFGLLLCLAGPWSAGPGSAVDFRLDHGAMCLMGLASAVALLTRGFRAPGWSLALGFVIGLTLLERFLTSVYFVGILIAAVIWIAAGVDRLRRLRNLGLAGLVAAAIALPVFWLNRTAIYTYYWVGQVASAEGDVRSPGLDLVHSIRYVGGALGRMHLGAWFAWTVAAVTVALVAGARLFRRRGASADRDWLFVATAFLLVPATVLCLHRQKSEYVLGVLVPGTVLLVLWAWAWLWQRIDFDAARYTGRWAAAVLALGTVGSGLAFFTLREVTPPYGDNFRDSARTVNQIADYIYASARDRHVTHPNIVVDQVVDFIDAQILQVMCYERHQAWVPFVIQLPNSILEDKDEVMFYRLKLGDFVLLTDDMPGNGYWPYDRQLRRLYPEFKAWSDANLRLAGTYTLFGRRMSLYERRNNP